MNFSEPACRKSSMYMASRSSNFPSDLSENIVLSSWEIFTLRLKSSTHTFKYQLQESSTSPYFTLSFQIKPDFLLSFEGLTNKSLSMPLPYRKVNLMSSMSSCHLWLADMNCMILMFSFMHSDQLDHSPFSCSSYPQTTNLALGGYLAFYFSSNQPSCW